ncbi:MAG: response regulator transcription factor [Spongiibacteraceae bacterium]|nr:response regulator transcription factor [Spongiibacteraceae bacterium]
MANAINHVLIVEDHPDAVEVLSQVVSQTFGTQCVATASTVAGGLLLLREKKFDMALIDIGLPDGSGIELVNYLSDHSPATLSVVTTIFDDENHLFEALQAGACGYILKGHSPDELSAYLSDAVGGRPPLSPSIAHSVLGYFRRERLPVEKEEETLSLTERETEILRLIAKGCQVKEVGQLLDIANNTVSVHIKNIYRKLNVHNRAEATAAAVNMQLFTPN